MQILKQSTMPDGTTIQLEDWQEDFLHIKILEIGAYPIAKNSNKNDLIESNKTFRLNLVGFSSNEQAKDTFNKLEKGEITLKELKEHFYCGKKDEYYLGIE